MLSVGGRRESLRDAGGSARRLERAIHVHAFAAFS